jgi:hypothetical protein
LRVEELDICIVTPALHGRTAPDPKRPVGFLAA